ncbi:sensor histidine kinase [Nocardioides taihuensis]|uniref:histidine kinase n=1 Tax=Nocardioides taihuensis TaxID=1835606 RepID=A0ABW0BLH9_9ACTN
MTWPRSLTARLVVTAVALVALVSVLIGAFAALATRSYLMGQLDDDVRAALMRAENSPPVTGQPVPLPDPDGDDESGEHGEPDDVRGQGVGTVTAYLYNDGTGSGNVLAGDRGGRVQTPALTQDEIARLQDVPVDGRAHTVTLGGYGEFRVLRSTRTVVAVGLPTSDTHEVLEQLLLWELLLTLLGVVIAAVAGTVVVRRQLRPLREVATTAHEVATLPLGSGEVDLAPRVPERLTDERTEVGQVGAALNTMLAHVETSLDARHRSEQQVRQFVADASHELRTPLATIAGYTELARRRPDDAAAAETALAKVDEESARMTRLVEDLLLLARLDAAQPLHREPVDLTRLLLEAVSDARVVSPDHQWRLELPDEAVEVTGDRVRLHQVVSNLLANARRHTPAGTTVTVRALPDGFAVHDDGPGFPPDLLDGDHLRAFERFSRGSASRTRGTAGALAPGTTGTGLGLSLVEAIVSAHGGRVELTSAPGDTTVAVHLPR